MPVRLRSATGQEELVRGEVVVAIRSITAHQLAPLQLVVDGNTLDIEAPASLIVNATDAMIDASLKGLGLGGILEPLVADALRTGTLLPVLRAHWPRVPGLHVYFMRDSQKARRVRLLIDFLREHFAPASAGH